jgi:hypothetical protein
MVAHSLLFSLKKEIPQRIFQSLSGDMPLAGIQSIDVTKPNLPLLLFYSDPFSKQARALT